MEAAFEIGSGRRSVSPHCSDGLCCMGDFRTCTSEYSVTLRSHPWCAKTRNGCAVAVLQAGVLPTWDLQQQFTAQYWNMSTGGGTDRRLPECRFAVLPRTSHQIGAHVRAPRASGDDSGFWRAADRQRRIRRRSCRSGRGNGGRRSRTRVSTLWCAKTPVQPISVGLARRVNGRCGVAFLSPDHFCVLRDRSTPRVSAWCFVSWQQRHTSGGCG